MSKECIHFLGHSVCDCGVESHGRRLFYLVLSRFKLWDTQVPFQKVVPLSTNKFVTRGNWNFSIYLASSATQVDEGKCYMLETFYW